MRKGSTTGKKCVTNGIVNIFVVKQDIPYYETLGYRKGSTYPKNRKPPTMTKEQLKERGEKIREKKLIFYQTELGKLVAKNIGEKNSVLLKEFYKTDKGIENRKKSSVLNSVFMKESIANGNFTPCITNTFTHWNAEILYNNEIKKFRSSWEACFWLCNPFLKYEYIRIPYYDKTRNKYRTYIADFYDETNNILYEIKPKSQWEPQDNKMQQIISYCDMNNITFKWINEYNIIDYIDENLFTENNIKQLLMLKKGINYDKIENTINQIF